VSLRREGFSLLEVLVALLILQVGVLGVIGLFTLAADRLVRALLVERAVAEVASLADSLSASGAKTGGELLRGDWRLSWQGDEHGLVVRAALRARPELGPVVELELP
jgi:type II secretory pathway pseudopilin PulG